MVRVVEEIQNKSSPILQKKTSFCVKNNCNGNLDNIIYDDHYTNENKNLNNMNDNNHLNNNHLKNNHLKNNHLKNNNNNKKKKKKNESLNFSFACGGWLKYYLFGVAKALMDHDLHKNARSTGSSAGAITALGMAVGEPEDMLQAMRFSRDYCLPHVRKEISISIPSIPFLWNDKNNDNKNKNNTTNNNGSSSRLLKMSIVSPSGMANLTQYISSALEAVPNFLNRYDQVQGKAEIHVTKIQKGLKGMCNARKSYDFHDRDDLKKWILASCAAVPLGTPIYIDRLDKDDKDKDDVRVAGCYCIDGGITAFQPAFQDDLQFEKTITVNAFYFMKADIKPSRYIPLWWSFLPPQDTDTIDWIFDLGYMDALQWMEKNNFGDPYRYAKNPLNIFSCTKRLQRNQHPYDLHHRLDHHAKEERNTDGGGGGYVTTFLKKMQRFLGYGCPHFAAGKRKKMKTQEERGGESDIVNSSSSWISQTKQFMMEETSTSSTYNIHDDDLCEDDLTFGYVAYTDLVIIPLFDLIFILLIMTLWHPVAYTCVYLELSIRFIYYWGKTFVKEITPFFRQPLLYILGFGIYMMNGPITGATTTTTTTTTNLIDINITEEDEKGTYFYDEEGLVQDDQNQEHLNILSSSSEYIIDIQHDNIDMHMNLNPLSNNHHNHNNNYYIPFFTSSIIIIGIYLVKVLLLQTTIKQNSSQKDLQMLYRVTKCMSKLQLICKIIPIVGYCFVTEISHEHHSDLFEDCLIYRLLHHIM